MLKLTATPKRVELFGGMFCWQIGDNFLCSDEFMEALKSHPLLKDSGIYECFKVNKGFEEMKDYLYCEDDYKIEQPPLPKKISKPKHTPPFWANNWRKK